MLWPRWLMVLYSRTAKNVTQRLCQGKTFPGQHCTVLSLTRRRQQPNRLMANCLFIIAGWLLSYRSLAAKDNDLMEMCASGRSEHVSAAVPGAVGDIPLFHNRVMTFQPPTAL